MIDRTEQYQAAIVGDAREILIAAIIDIIDPDITYGTVTADGAGVRYAKPEQLHDKVTTAADPYATLEHNRWKLDGAFSVAPEDAAAVTGEVGYVGNALAGADGTFAPPVWVQMSFSNVAILQACSIYFHDSESDGVPADFTVEILQGGTAYYTKTYTGSTANSISLSAFTVYNPDAIRITVTKWSLPYRRMRIAEIIPGVYEEWDADIVTSLDITQQCDISCVTLPYGTCTLKMANLDKRFEPRSKSGVFQSIDERQGIDIKLGVRLESGVVERKRLGIYYQHSGGWKTGDNGLSMQWDLVDIVGLLSDRAFLPPDTLPTTLSGWVAALVAQLGDNFATRYHVDPDYADVQVEASRANNISGRTCGEILRYACMAAGAWARADAETGYLAVEPLWSQGNKLTLDNLMNYPTMKANDDVAALVFTVYDGNDTEIVVSGNSTASSDTRRIDNPFIHTQAAALTAARLILSTFGGNRLETVGRGDMTSEMGDVDTVWLDESSATTGRRIKQTFSFQDGVMANCQSVLLQADGSFLYQNRVILTESGSWSAPDGVNSLRVILVGKGADGAHGDPGTNSNPDVGIGGTQGQRGADGADGIGGKVWAGTISINANQQFTVLIGSDTVFGAYSSANGAVYPLGYTDIASGNSYARTGVEMPQAGSGDGGKGGAGGDAGYEHIDHVFRYNEDGSIGAAWYFPVVDQEAGQGEPGAIGATGCVIIYYDKEETA